MPESVVELVTRSPAEVADAVALWVAERTELLDAYRRERPGSIEDAVDHQRGLQRLLAEAGWTRLGWPVSCGGLGGSHLLRAAALEALTAAGYELPELLFNLEVIAPMLVRYAPTLAAEHLPAAVAGDEVWCQGFSEPDAGSDLGSLRTRAADHGDHFVVTGSKTWSSNGHMADRCCLLCRTGDAGEGYRGLTMLWVDLDSPGITRRPIACSDGRNEVAELFFDEVTVPKSRLIGDVGAGWSVVMFLLQFERGAFAWSRQAELHLALDALLADQANLPHDAPTLVADAYLRVFALRSKCRTTLGKLDEGVELGPEISVDKILLGAAEQAVADTARRFDTRSFVLGDDGPAVVNRRRWWYSRITTIYGGAVEVQRDLVAERLLGLPRVR